MAEDHKTQQPDMHKAARWYARQGMHIVRGYPATTPDRVILGKDGKERRIKRVKRPNVGNRWEEQATTDLGQIDAWFSNQSEEPIICWAVGRDNVLTLDLDEYKAAYGELPGELPETPEQITGGGGRHICFRMEAGDTFGNSTKGLPNGIDIRGHGGQIVVAPSLHPSGKRYRWVDGRAPWECEFAPIPQWLRDILEAHTSGKRSARIVATAADFGTDTTGGRTLTAVRTALSVKNVAILRPDVVETDDRGNTTVKIQSECTTSKEHADGAFYSVVVAGPDAGRIGYYCNHNSCQGKHAAALRFLGIVPEQPRYKFTQYNGEIQIELPAGEYLADHIAWDSMPRAVNLHAQTGTGKTTAVLAIDGNLLIVVPLAMIALQIWHANSAASIAIDGINTVMPDSPLIVTTYDSLPKVLEQIDAAKYSLAVDESHMLMTTANYRGRAVNNVLNVLDDAWRRVVMLSGTPMPLPGLRADVFRTAAVKSAMRTQPYTFVHYEKGNRLAAVAQNVSEDPEAVDVIVLNSKGSYRDKLIKLLQKLGKLPADDDQLDLALVCLDSESKDEKPYQHIVNNQALLPGVKVVMTTAVLEAGVNIKDRPKRVHFVDQIVPEILQQFVSRFRGAEAPDLALVYTNGEGKRAQYDLAKHAAERFTRAQSWVDFANGNRPTDAASLEEWDAWEADARTLGAAVVLEEDDHGAKRYEIDRARLYAQIYGHWISICANHPNVIAHELARYGWERAEDTDRAFCMLPDVRAALNEAAEEAEEERRTAFDYALEQVKADGAEDSARLLKGVGLSDDEKTRADHAYKEIAGNAHKLARRYGLEFDDALEAIRTTEGKHQRMTEVKRKLRAAKMLADGRGMARHIAATFSPGDRLTPHELRERVTDALRLEKHTAMLLDTKAIDADDPRWARQLVNLFFTTKRCKIRTEDGRRVNGVMIVSDVPSIGDCELSQCKKVNSNRVALIQTDAPPPPDYLSDDEKAAYRAALEALAAMEAA